MSNIISLEEFRKKKGKKGKSDLWTINFEEVGNLYKELKAKNEAKKSKEQKDRDKRNAKVLKDYKLK